MKASDPELKPISVIQTFMPTIELNNIPKPEANLVDYLEIPSQNSFGFAGPQ